MRFAAGIALSWFVLLVACEEEAFSTATYERDDVVVDAGAVSPPPEPDVDGFVPLPLDASLVDVSAPDAVADAGVCTCGTSNDLCCPLGCGSATDDDCGGTGWRYVALGEVDTTGAELCTTIALDDVEAAGRYEITTCSPPGEPEPRGGDPVLESVTDAQDRAYPTNDDCLSTTSLPFAAGSRCRNDDGLLTMVCASESPSGFRLPANPGTLTLRFCAKDGLAANAGRTPLYVWYSASRAPRLSVASSTARPPRVE